jgi:RNA polymerase sigma factor (sigma-70 family)
MDNETYKVTDVNLVALTAEQEMALLKSWRLHRTESARETLVKNYVLFSVKLVGRMYRYLPQDSVMLIAHSALLYSIDAFDHTREKVGRLCTLIPFYAKVAHREHVRSSKVVNCPNNDIQFQFQSLDAPKPLRHENSRTGPCEVSSLGDYLGLPREDLHTVDHAELETLLGFNWSALEETEQREKMKDVIECLESLKSSHRKILKMVYFKGLTFAEVARQLKPAVTREAVRQKHLKAIQHLRDAVEEKGIFNCR